MTPPGPTVRPLVHLVPRPRTVSPTFCGIPVYGSRLAASLQQPPTSTRPTISLTLWDIAPIFYMVNMTADLTLSFVYNMMSNVLHIMGMYLKKRHKFVMLSLAGSQGP